MSFKSEIAVCTNCDAVISKGHNLPKPDENAMFCWTCGTLSRDYEIKDEELGQLRQLGEQVSYHSDDEN